MCGVSIAVVIGEVGCPRLMFPDLYRGFWKRSGSTHVAVLRRGIIVTLPRSGARSRAAESAAETPFRVGLYGAASEDDPQADDHRHDHRAADRRKNPRGRVPGARAGGERDCVPRAARPCRSRRRGAGGRHRPGLDELEQRVAPPAASDANERDETALGAGIFFRGARSPSRTAGRPPLRIGRPCPLPRLGPARSYRSAFRLWGRRPPRARGNRP